ncbi:MAG: preprotein translocase subunit SecG [Bacteroidaceae bacterium]|nr:preprotein translocase subunit SecG [Bacteroidaceae bacterium]MBP5347253.1 preprotein translocase subunit SecG [Bacteroidaceae bacterium]
MFKVLLIIIVILALFLCFVVTIQNSKGGGLAAGFASSNQIMGVRKTTDILEKTTWTLIASIAVLSIITAYVSKPVAVNASSVMEGEAIENQMVNPESSTTTFDAPLEIQDLPEE